MQFSREYRENLTTEEKRKEIDGISDFNICLPGISEMMNSSLSVVPLQLFAGVAKT